MEPRLRLFRRHTANCTKGHPKDLRVFEHDRGKKAQCECTIVAQGTLPNGTFLKHKSTAQNTWTAAKKVAALYWEWNSTKPPADVVREIARSRNQSAAVLSDVVQDFLTKKENAKVGHAVRTHHRQLLKGRLLPFAAIHGYQYVQQMDNAKAWEDFRNSWTNQNPLHNRPERFEVVPVAPKTAQRMLGQVRQFVRYCIGRNLLTKNWTDREFLSVQAPTEPKEFGQIFFGQNRFYFWAVRHDRSLACSLFVRQDPTCGEMRFAGRGRVEIGGDACESSGRASSELSDSLALWRSSGAHPGVLDPPGAMQGQFQGSLGALGS